MFARHHHHPPPPLDPDQQLTAHLTAARAQIELDDAAAHRALQVREREIDLADRERRAADEARQRAADRKAQRRAERAAERRQRRGTRRDKRAAWWETRKTRFGQLLSGRLVALLVALAMATAWYGQYRFLHAPTQPTGPEPAGLGLLMPFATAGATALEVFGLAMFAIVRQAGRHRDRAVRARVLGWSVIAFSAWSNLTHNGAALAALSVIGPLGWEVHEWWRHREILHTTGKIIHRPVRPRFPLDQVLLYPLWTLRAYRVAVRDRIESTDQALALGLVERDRGRAFSRRTRRRWARDVRALLAESARRSTPDTTSTVHDKHGEHVDHEPTALPTPGQSTEPATADSASTSRHDTAPDPQASTPEASILTQTSAPIPPTADATEVTPTKQDATPGQNKTDLINRAIDEALTAGTPLRDINGSSIAKAHGASPQLGRRAVGERRKQAMAHLVQKALAAGTIADLTPAELARQVGGDKKHAAQLLAPHTDIHPGSTRRNPKTRPLRRAS